MIRFNKIQKIILSILVLLSLHCPLSVIETVDTGNVIVNVFLKFANSFISANPLVDLLEILAVYGLWKFVSSRDITVGISTIILSFVMSFFFVTGVALSCTDSLSFVYSNPYQVILFLFCLVGYTVLLSLLIASLENIVCSCDFAEDNDAISSKRIFLISMITIFSCWFIWLIVYFPGTMSLDAASQLNQTSGDVWHISNHQPPLSTLFMTGYVNFGKILGNKSYGIFIYCLLQELLGAFTFAYGIRYLFKKGLNKKICIGIMLFFAITPMWADFSQYFEKDFLYTVVLTLNFILLLETELTEFNVRQTLLIALTGILACFLRNNGIYVIIPFYIAVIIASKSKKKPIVITGIVLFAFLIVTKGVYPAVGVEKDSMREMMSIPFQQTARYVKEFPDEVTIEERESIDLILPYDDLAENYEPRISDPIKDNFKGDDSLLPQYFATWARMLLKHPGVYIEAFLNQCYGYLAPVEENAPIPAITPYPESAENMGIYREPLGHAASFLECMRLLSITWPIVKVLDYPGFYTWIVVICAFILIKNRHYKVIPFYIPALFNLLICIASPLQNEMRYALPIVAVAPFYVGMVALTNSVKN